MPSARTATAARPVDLSALAGSFLMELASAGRSASTLEKYKLALNHLTSFLCDRNHSSDIRLVTKEQLKAYAEEVYNFAADTDYKRTWIGRIKSFFGWAMENALILADPSRLLSRPAVEERKHPAYLSKEEVARLLDGIPTINTEGLRDRALLELMYSTGLRSQEVRRLRLNDIDFTARTVIVVQGKGGKDRVVPVGRVALRWLDRYIAETPQFRAATADPLFTTLDGRPMRRWYVRDIFAKHKAAARIRKRCHPGILRHSFAIHLLEGGAGIREIAAMMGHVKLETTQIYTQIVAAELIRVHRRSHPAERRRASLPQVHPRRIG